MESHISSKILSIWLSESLLSKIRMAIESEIHLDSKLILNHTWMAIMYSAIHEFAKDLEMPPEKVIW